MAMSVLASARRRTSKEIDAMTERIMNINALPSFIVTMLHSKKVRVSESNRVITIIPVENENEEYSCPFYGIGTDFDLTVDKFLEWKREEREREYEQEIRS
jgi:hypothetical protein